MKKDKPRYKNLEVWKLADEIALNVYEITRGFPKEEIFGVTSQLRRSALSVPTNIVEGYSRKGDKELSRFVSIALGSLGESRYLLDFSRRLGYLEEDDFLVLKELIDKLGRKLWRFSRSINQE